MEFDYVGPQIVPLREARSYPVSIELILLTPCYPEFDPIIGKNIVKITEIIKFYD